LDPQIFVSRLQTDFGVFLSPYERGPVDLAGSWKWEDYLRIVYG
jgi:hypothetical protein